MNKKLKGIGSLVGKAAAIIGTAGAASLLSDMFLFGGKLTSNSDGDDETTTKTNNDVQMPDVTEESEHFKEEDVKVEDEAKDKEETE